jgi:hypothetical protein
MIYFSELENAFYATGINFMDTVFSSMVGLAGYILLALGLYTIAKRRGIRNPWLAWIPLGQSWMMGCVSDQYQYVAQGRQKSKRKIILWLEIATAILLAITIILLFIAWIDILPYVDLDALAQYGEEYFNQDLFENLSDAERMQIASSMMRAVLPSFLLMGAAVALTVIRYMALYDLYRSCEPSSAGINTAVSIFLGSIAMGILVLLNRSKDFGMKPRQNNGYQEPGQLPPEQNWQPPQQPRDPWENNNQQW